MTTRAATPADAAALDRIFDTSFCDTFAHLYRREDLEQFLAGFSLDQWRAQLADPAYAFRIGQSEGGPVGYVKLGPLKLPIEPGGPALLLDQMYLLKEHHGSGIAPALMDWAIEEARRRGAHELYLTVFTENHRARRFYERYGFEPVGRYEFMVGSHVDEDVIMRKIL
jgi:GNAT superfamily N-acetyltransferase